MKIFKRMFLLFLFIFIIGTQERTASGEEFKEFTSSISYEMVQANKDLLKKTWTIDFSKEVDRNSIELNNNIYLLENGEKVELVDLLVQENDFGQQASIIVTPKHPYKWGGQYELIITDTVKAKERTNALIPARLTFSVVDYPLEKAKVKLTFEQSTYIAGDTVIIKGFVSSENDEPLVNLPIEIDGSASITDSQGNFEINILALNNEKMYEVKSGNTILNIEEGNTFKRLFSLKINEDNISFSEEVTTFPEKTIDDLITYSQDELVFKGDLTSYELQPGEVIITPPTDNFPQGMVRKVSSVQKGNNQTIIKTTTPELDEIFETLDIEGVSTLDIDNIIPTEGVTVTSYQPDYRTRDLDINNEGLTLSFDKTLLDYNDDYTFENSELEILLNGRAKINLKGQLDIIAPKVDYSIDLLNVDVKFINEQHMLIDLNGNIAGSGEVNVKLGKIQIPVYGPISFIGELWIFVGAKGEVDFKVVYNQTTEFVMGVEGSPYKVDPIGNFELTDSSFNTYIDGKVTISTGLKPRFKLTVLDLATLGLHNEVGIKGTWQGTVENRDTEDLRVCIKSDISIYATADGVLEKPIKAILPSLFDWSKGLAKSDTCPVISALSFETTNPYVERGETIQLQVNAITEDKEILNYSAKKDGTTYEISDPKFGTVDKDGLLSISNYAPVNESFTITARNGKKEVTQTFTIIEIIKVYSTPSTLELRSGEKKRLIVKALLSNNKELILNNSNFIVKFNSEDSMLATVKEDGMVTIEKDVLPNTETSITVTVRDQKFQVPVTVLPSYDENGNPILGIVDSSPVAAGYKHSVGVKEDGSVWTWGINKNGQLGNGSTLNSLAPVKVSGLPWIISVAAGMNHTLALANDGTVWAWGSNVMGQLGNGTYESSLVPVKVEGIENAVSIGVGADTSYAILPNGSVKAWGSNTRGLLGNGTTVQNSNIPVPVSELTGIVSIDSSLNIYGERHTIALKSDGTVWAWGANYFGAVGNGPHLNNSGGFLKTIIEPVPVANTNGSGKLNNIVSIDAGATSSLALDRDGIVYGWGNNWGDEFFNGVNHPVIKTGNNGDELKGVKAISSGDFYPNSLVKDDGTVWYWNGLGNLIQIPSIENAKHVSLGGFHLFILTEDNRIFGWGWNDEGQLGNGTIIGTTVDTTIQPIEIKY